MNNDSPVSRRDLLDAIASVREKLTDYIDAHEKWGKAMIAMQSERLDRLEAEVHGLHLEISKQSRAWKATAAIAAGIGMVLGWAITQARLF